jgi:uncharacterized protein YjhX (UPF0386 family)
MCLLSLIAIIISKDETRRINASAKCCDKHAFHFCGANIVFFSLLKKIYIIKLLTNEEKDFLIEGKLAPYSQSIYSSF